MIDTEFQAKWNELDEDDRERLSRLIEQMKRAQDLGLIIRFDDHTGAFFLADRDANTVVAPPPMNIETVTAWLDDYEQEATE